MPCRALDTTRGWGDGARSGFALIAAPMRWLFWSEPKQLIGFVTARSSRNWGGAWSRTGRPTAGAIEIEFVAGARMRIIGAVAAATLQVVVAALAEGTPVIIPIPSGVRVWIATRHPDMRRGMHPLGQTSDVLQAAVCSARRAACRGRRHGRRSL